MNKFFLGGTCANTTWRDKLISLAKYTDFNYFNPVVKDWTPECQKIEEDEKNNKCNIHLYTITPEMEGVYSIAEIVNSTWQAQLYGTNTDMTLMLVMGNENDFGKKMWKSLMATIRLCENIAPGKFIGSSVLSPEGIKDLLVAEDLIRPI